MLFVVCIIGILVAIAYPSYQSQLYKIRRSEGQQNLLLLAASLEDNYSKNNRYPSHDAIFMPQSEYYEIQIASLSHDAYVLEAVPKSDSPQEKDPCGILSITNRQIMKPEASCWQ